MPDTTEITIADVAQAAGVSVSTVSRILNNKPDVAEATRRRVQQVIEALGYAPHVQAQRLAAGKSQTIALLFSADYKTFTYLELDFFIGAAAAAGEENFFFNLITTPVTESNLLGLYRSAQVDGVILMQIHLQDWRVDFLRQNDFPFIMIGRCADNTGLSFIDLDFEGAIITAFDHLVELGHRHIGFLTFLDTMHQQGYGPAVRSLVGYDKAQQKHGLVAPCLKVGTTVQDTFEATVQLLEQQPQLTAIVAVQGSTVVGVLRALRQLGRTVPRDFSVIAIATDKIAQLITPPLTAIDFPTNTAGYQAAKMLIGKLKQIPLETDQILLPPRLVVRQSTGPLKE